MMAVVDLDSIVVIYSGVTRIGALYGKYEFNLKHSPAGMQVPSISTNCFYFRRFRLLKF